MSELASTSVTIAAWSMAHARVYAEPFWAACAARTAANARDLTPLGVSTLTHAFAMINYPAPGLIEARACRLPLAAAALLRREGRERATARCARDSPAGRPPPPLTPSSPPPSLLPPSPRPAEKCRRWWTRRCRGWVASRPRRWPTSAGGWPCGWRSRRARRSPSACPPSPRRVAPLFYSLPPSFSLARALHSLSCALAPIRALTATARHPHSHTHTPAQALSAELARPERRYGHVELQQLTQLDMALRAVRAGGGGGGGGDDGGDGDGGVDGSGRVRGTVLLGPSLLRQCKSTWQQARGRACPPRLPLPPSIPRPLLTPPPLPAHPSAFNPSTP